MAEGQLKVSHYARLIFVPQNLTPQPPLHSMERGAKRSAAGVRSETSIMTKLKEKAEMAAEAAMSDE
jgi:hypothetical protein